MDKQTMIDQALAFAIGEEQAAAEFYTQLAARAKAPAMREVFESFAREERLHKTKLEAIKAGGAFKLAGKAVADLKIADYTVEVEPNPNLDYRGALLLAMKKEKAAFKLYSDLAAGAPDEDMRAVFLTLAQEEAKHKLRFEIEYDDLMAEN